jgi:hypothetical protein
MEAQMTSSKRKNKTYSLNLKKNSLRSSLSNAYAVTEATEALCSTKTIL